VGRSTDNASFISFQYGCGDDAVCSCVNCGFMVLFFSVNVQVVHLVLARIDTH